MITLILITLIYSFFIILLFIIIIFFYFYTLKFLLFYLTLILFQVDQRIRNSLAHNIIIIFIYLI